MQQQVIGLKNIFPAYIEMQKKVIAIDILIFHEMNETARTASEIEHFAFDTKILTYERNTPSILVVGVSLAVGGDIARRDPIDQVDA
jgi:hypothetical protein